MWLGGVRVEQVQSIIDIFLSNGGTVVMAVLFIIFLYLDRKDRKEKDTQDEVRRKEEQEEKKAEREASNKLLSELSASNRNIAESLNLLKTSMDNTNTEFKQHDERAIAGFQAIHEDLIVLKERGK